MTKSSQNQQWILTAVRMAEIKKKKNNKKEQFQPWQIHSAVWNRKAHDPNEENQVHFHCIAG